MKSKNPKIQTILKKGIVVLMSAMLTLTPIVQATSSLDDNYLDSSWIDELLYGTVGSTAKEIKEWFEAGHTTLYITNEIQLRALAEYINNGNNCLGKKIVLLNNIEVNSNEEWIPIGRIDEENKPFKGIFDGKGYTISGINFNRNNKLASELTNVGLFGYTSGATIKNVNIANSKFDIPYDISSDIINPSKDLINYDDDDDNFSYTYQYLGGIVGYNNGGSIENCIIQSDVYINGLARVGGISGRNNGGTIINCTNHGTVKGAAAVGGIAGMNIGRYVEDENFTSDNYAKIVSCTNNGTIYGLLINIGGISGQVFGNGIIQKSENNGLVANTTEEITLNINGEMIKYNPQNTAGIAGYVSGGMGKDDDKIIYCYAVVDACINNGEIRGYLDVGGIAGQLGGLSGGDSIFTNNINYSTDIYGSDETETGFLAGYIGTYGRDHSVDGSINGDNIEYTRVDDPHVYLDNNFWVKKDDSVGDEWAGKCALFDEKPLYSQVDYLLKIDDNSYVTVETTYILVDDKNGGFDVWYYDRKIGSLSEFKDLCTICAVGDPRYSGSWPDVNYCSANSTTGYLQNWYDESLELQLIYSYEEPFKKDGNKSKLIINNSNQTSNYGDIINTETATTVTYDIDWKLAGTSNFSNDHNNDNVKDNDKSIVYFKEGDTIRVTAKFNKYLAKRYNQLEKITAPTLKLNNSIEMTAGTVNVNTTNYETTIAYTYTVSDNDNLEITSLNLTKSGTIYIISGSDYATNHPSINGINSSEDVSGLIIDTIAPSINTRAYVENALETGRYTAGKEILIEVTTNEEIQDLDELPEIQVSFSESGVGKYNYSTGKPGYARCKEGNINSNRTVTLLYSYQVQEGDEGDIQLLYKSGEISDLAGNSVDIENLYTPVETATGSAVTGSSWNNELGVSYELYKNSVSEANKVTAGTYFTENDDLVVRAVFDKVLYISYGSSGGVSLNLRMNNTYIGRVPSLYLNGDSSIRHTSASITTQTNSTIIDYKFDMSTYNIDNLVRVNKLTLKNENNAASLTKNGKTISPDGKTPFADAWYSTYTTADQSKYKELSNNAVKNTTEITNIILDTNGISDSINLGNIYADTTAPTATIKFNNTNPTNADLITYEIEFSEYVEGFEVTDITVNNGNRKDNTFTVVTEGLKYTIDVEPIITIGNQGELQVIIEEGACKDLVAINNVRQESKITIDKVKPTITSYDIYETTGKIIIEATFSEALSDASDLMPFIYIGGNEARGEFVDFDSAEEGIQEAQIYDSNKVRFEYKKDGSDGGEVYAALLGDVTDVAGNDSEELDVELENNITLVQTVIRDGVDIYSFKKGNESIIDFTNPTYFVKGDTIVVLKNGEQLGSYEVTETIDITHMNSMSIEEVKEANATTYKLSFSAEEAEKTEKSDIDISEANIWFDTVAPRVTTEVTAVNPKEIYTTGEELIIRAKTSEGIEILEVEPKISVKFNGKDGKFNGGKAELISEINDDIGTIWIYRYVVSEGDEGAISLSYDDATITDFAGNSTQLTTLNGQENIFNLNNIIVDATAPTVEISAEKVETDSEGNIEKSEISNNVTNATKLEYTFKWSEEVVGFTKEDITVNNGTKGTLSPGTRNGDGSYTYTLEITPTVAAGNEDNLQVIVEQNACQDKVGHENVRNESIIKVDKISPIFIGLESYAESTISLDSNVDTVKQYYKAGDKVTIIATFTENIESSNVPTLNLQFSESGNAKAEVSPGVKSGNKITYTYTIANGDMGTLSVKGFSGNVTDKAGNVTKVTKRALDGDTIIADTRVPNLNELRVVEPDKGVYKAGETIVIEAIYDEEIYELENNVIKLITSENAPTLKLKFGEGTERTATAVGYGITDGKEDRTKIEYTYTIVGGDNGDNEILKLTSYAGKTVCDIAGNVVTLGVNQTGNEITADTIRPTVTKIEAKVKDSLIKGINGDPSDRQTGYYKVGNEVTITLTFSEPVSGAVIMPEILVGFFENPDVEPTAYNTYAYESDWNVNSTTIEYSYTIKDGDNGYLWIKVPENQFADEAGNGNVEKTADRLENIFADTTDPTLTIYRDTEVIQDGQRITVKATFSENVYNLVDDERKTFIINNDINTAPIMIYGFGENGNLEAKAEKVEGNVITYVITKENTVSGEFYHAYFKGNVYDRAGNPCFRNDTDTIAPVLESVVISTNAGIYHPYCKTGTEIYVTATFDEPIKVANIKLKAKVGEVEISELDGTIVEEYPYQVKFTYTVKEGDMEAFQILDVCGNKDNTITEENADNTYGYVQDEHGNQKNIYSLASEGITVSGRAEADTKAPYITSIRAISNDKEIATYTKEEGKEPVITVGRTNGNIVEYIVTYSEKVPYSHFENILITNGVIRGDVEYTNSDLNEYKITVQTTVEGVQSLIINEGTVEDKAGNIDGFVRFDAVTTDFTKPTVRFISEYNGGVYVLPTNIGKVEIRPNVEISEDIAKIEYKWDNGEYVKIENYSSSSDIAVPTKSFTEAGQYKLFIKVEDLAGNVYETSKTYEIKNSKIYIVPNIDVYTNEPITVTVKFKEGLTDNRKVTFKAENSNNIVELNAIGTDEKGNTQYIITENGIVYAEATDRVGNKVFEEENITNIDTQEPVVEITLNGADLVIGTGKDKAVIKTNVKTSDNKWVEEAKYVFLQEDIDVSEYSEWTEEQKATIKTKIINILEDEVQIEAESTKDKPYYLYVLAVDAAGNETIVKSNSFTVVDTNERTITVEKDYVGDITNAIVPMPGQKVEEEVTVAPEKPISELIIFKKIEEKEKDKAYVDVEFDDSIIRSFDITLDNEDYGYVGEYNNVELYGNTKIIVKAWDACGNEVVHECPVTDIEGPEFTITGNPEVWTNGDVNLEILSEAPLATLTLEGKDILDKENNYIGKTVITEYGEYTFEATDIYNNTSKQTIEVKIDKSAPEITDVKIDDGKIVITANDIDETLNRELSGVAEYAITDTTEVPVEWSKSNVINVTKDANFFVWVKDNAGNIAEPLEEIIVRDITAPKLTVTTDVKLDKWTNTDIKVNVKSDEELSSLVIKYKETVEQDGQTTEVEKEENILETKTYTITSNGSYEIIGTDKSGNTTKETITVTKIDKDLPEISEVKTVGKEITITATDAGSDVKGYAITNTTEVPVEWSKSNVIKVTEDGIFYAWVKDNAGNIVRKEETIIVDTTAPIITFSYLSQTVTVGMPLEANIVTNEDATISYSWDKENWVNSETLVSSLTVSKKSTTPGKYTLYVKATDGAGNESGIQVLEFTVSNIEEIKQPDIIFEDIPTIQVNGAKYVKVSSKATIETLTDSMNKEALYGKTPEYKNLTEDKKLKTGSEIAINGKTKYIIIVNGDVNCDGQVTFLGDVVMANNYRIGQIGLKTIQKLAADINNNGVIEFIPDIVAINNYRLGIINSL